MPCTIQIVYWRDIPSQVKARAGRTRVSRPLTERFEKAIDAAAMRAGATATDAYLAEWRNGEPMERATEPEAAADTLAAELEAAYPAERLRALIAAAGREPPVE